MRRTRWTMVRGRSRFASVCVPLALLLLTGCGHSLVGHWQLTSASPNREVFSLDDVEFAKDGGFTATTTIEGRTRRESGTFHYDGIHLTLRPAAGGQRKYNAQLRLNTLRLADGDRRVTLERE